MAKRKTTSKKKTAKKPAGKKAPARKKSASKKKTTKKVATKKVASKKTGAKKSTSRKKAASKKAPAKKKAASKKKASTTKRTTTKKSAKKPSSKKTTSKKSPAKKTSAAGKKAPAKKGGASSKKADDAKLKEARAAASRLAALAGLPSVQSNQMAEPAAEKKKRRLTKSPLTAAALEKFRELLLEKRREVAGDVSAIEGEALNPSRSGSLSSLPQHMADQGSDEFEQTLSLGIAATQRKLLIEIEAALDRIDNGVYGICEMTGRAIAKARLEATPWCRYSLEGAQMADRGLTP